MASPPTGTVSFLFTDIEGSTHLAQEHPEAMAGLLERHHAILKSAIEAHAGYTFQIIGDAFCAAFESAEDAVEAAIEAQRRLGAAEWDPAPVHVRMGISTGAAQVRIQDGHAPDYSGYVTLARVQRIMSLARGGQVLLSSASAEVLHDALRPDVSLLDLGEHRLKDLRNPERLWQVVAPGLPQDFPALAPLHTTPNNLPVQLTSFIGREKEIRQIKDLLHKHRLVTLTGSGGTGKTRLALQVAPDLLDDYPDGLWLVELAPVHDGTLVAQTVLHILGLQAESERSPLDVLTQYLSDKSLLILLDNCEHLLEQCSSFVEAVLQAAPAVKILATSREILNLAGEQAYRVPSLAAPDANHLPGLEQLAQFEAVQLFLERVALASPGFALTQGNAPALAQICRRLDGIPLALELAAARVKSMPLEAMVSRLDDRFRLLTGGSRNSLPRQQTLRAAIDWSYALLSEAERLLLQRLSVFRGGCTLDEAEEVCSGERIEKADVLDLLSRLVDKSLLSLDEAGRYQMLETVRQYAGEKLIDAGQAEWARDRHLQFMLDLGERAEPEVRGQHQLLWLDRLEPELDNLRAALAWAQDRSAETSLRLTSALWRFWAIRVDAYEAMDMLEKAISQAGEQPTLARSRALARLVWMMDAGISFYYMKPVGNLEQQAYDLSIALQDKPSMAMVLSTLALTRVPRRPGEAISFAKQSLDLARELGDHWLARDPLLTLGIEALTRNALAEASPYLEGALEEARLSGDNRLIANNLTHVAWAARIQGHAERARALLQEALAIAESIGDGANIALAQSELALVSIFLQDYASAEALLEQALAWGKAASFIIVIARAREELAVLEWARGNGSKVCEWAQACLNMARQIKDETVAAEALCLLAGGHRLNGENDLARLGFIEALTAARAESFRAPYCYALQGFGAVALACGQPERAVRLFAARARLRETTFAEDYYPFMVRERERQIEQARARLGDEAFDSAWAAGQGMSEDEMLSYAVQAEAPPE